MMKKLCFLVGILVIYCNSMQAQHLNRSTFEISAGGGRRGIINSLRGVGRATITAGYNLRINAVVDLKVAADALYFDKTNENLLKSWSAEPWAYGAVIGSDFKLNRIIFTNGVGRYIYFASVWNKNSPNDMIQYYTKIGFRYLITKNLTAGFIMRAHRTQADYIDFGVSVRF